jgi:hypothetical protein
MSQDAPVTDVVGGEATWRWRAFRFCRGLAPLVLGPVLVAALFRLLGRLRATAAATRKALQDGGYGWPASVSGRGTVEGKPPSRAEADKVIAAISRARASTFGEAERRPVIELHLYGRPAAPARRPAHDLGATPPARTGRCAFRRTPADQRCDQSMADLLGGSTIEFASNSSVIRSAARCWMALPAPPRPAPVACASRHTDNEGRCVQHDAEPAPRRGSAHGLDPSRVSAPVEGFAAKPVAPNETEAGRARNRRIEIRAVSASPN